MTFCWAAKDAIDPNIAADKIISKCVKIQIRFNIHISNGTSSFYDKLYH